MDRAASQSPVELEPERQLKAKAYHRLKMKLSLAITAIGAIGVIFLLATRLDIWLRNLLQGLSWQPLPGYYPLQIIVYFLILLLCYEIITFPIVYYRDYVINTAPKERKGEQGSAPAHRYGLSVMTLKQWLVDRLKGFALSLVLETALISLIYALLAFQPQWWWLWVAVVLLFFSVVMANLAPVLILPLFYKFTPLPEGELTQRLMALAARANTKVRGVFTMHMSSKTTTANAALMGLGNTRRIVVGDTMMDRYTPDEIEVVLAHELGHHVHHDIWKMLISQSVLTLGGLFVANLLLHWVVDTQHFYHSLTDAATLPFFFLLTGLFGLIVMPLGNSYSRRIEYQADEYALQATHKVEAFKSVMTRLANQNLADVEPLPVVELLFHSHPSISKRLKHADEFATRGSSLTPSMQH